LKKQGSEYNPSVRRKEEKNMICRFLLLYLDFFAKETFIQQAPEKNYLSIITVV